VKKRRYDFFVSVINTLIILIIFPTCRGLLLGAVVGEQLALSKRCPADRTGGRRQRFQNLRYAPQMAIETHIDIRTGIISLAR
jgi:hypothetical protein